MRPTNEPNSERSTLSQRAPLPRHRKMKATWITSSLAGAIFGAVIYALERNGEKTDMAFVSPLFFAVFLIGAIGIAQIREMYAERRKRNLGFFRIMTGREDFIRFYFPAWGRMFVWFAAVVVTLLSLKAWPP